MNWKSTAVLIPAAGSAGGFCGVLASKVLDQPFPGGALWAWAAAPFLGALAGFVGVIMLANSDRRDLARCVAFAAVCGFAWKPVLDAVTALVAVKNAGESARTETKLAGAALAEAESQKTSAPAEAAKKFNEAAQLTQSAIAAARLAGNDELKEELRRKLDQIENSATSLQSNVRSLIPMETLRHSRQMLDR